LEKLLKFLKVYTEIANGTHKTEDVEAVFDEILPKVITLSKADPSALKVVNSWDQYHSKVITLDQFAHEVHAHSTTLLGETFGVNPAVAMDVAVPVLNGLALGSDFQLISRSYVSNAMSDSISQLDETIIAGYASVAVVDREDHLIPLKVLEKAFADFMARGEEYRAVQYQHSNLRIGTVLESWTSPTTGITYTSKVDDVGLYVVCRLRSDTSLTKKVVEEVRNGALRCFSVFGLAKGTPLKKTRGTNVYFEVQDFELEEITACPLGVNQGARFMLVKAQNAAKLDIIINSFKHPIDLGIEFTVQNTVDLPPGFDDGWLRRAILLRLYRHGVKGKFSLALQPEGSSVFVMKGSGLRLSDYTVALVGGVVNKGYSFHDIDILIKTPKTSLLGRAIKREVGNALSNELSDMARFIFEEAGPHGDFVPLFSLRAISRD